MPPKGKKGGKSKKKKEYYVDDIKNTTNLTFNKLVKYLENLSAEVAKEREEKLKFLTERDKMSLFWKIDRSKIEVYQNRKRNVDRLIEEQSDIYEKKLQEYLQKQKHLNNELVEELSEIRRDNQAELINLMHKHETLGDQLKKDNKELASQIVETELSAERELRKVKLQNSEELDNVMSNFKQALKESIDYSELVLQTRIEKLEEERWATIKNVENLKDDKLLNFVKVHDKEMKDLTHYYNSILIEDIGLLNDTEDEIIAHQQRNDTASAKENAIVGKTDKNRNLMISTRDAIKQLKEINRLLTLKNIPGQLVDIEKKIHQKKAEFEDTLWNKDMLHQKYEREVQFLDELRPRFLKAVCELQQIIALKRTQADRCLTL